MRHRAVAALGLYAVAVVLVATLPQASAGAAEVPQPGSSRTPVVSAVPGVVDVQYWMEEEPGAAVAIVSATLDPSVTLPATVRIPIPEGMTVEWAGEISDSGNIDDDIARTHTLATGSGGSYAEFELSTYRVGQIDLGAIPVSTSGDTVTSEFRYTQSVPASATAFSVRMPALVSELAIVPAPAGGPQVNESGQALYTLPSKSMKVGDTQVVSVSYGTGPQDAPGAQGGDALDWLMWVLAGGVVIGVGALVWLGFRSAGAHGNGDSESGGSEQAGSLGPSAEAGFDETDEPFSVDE